MPGFRRTNTTVVTGQNWPREWGLQSKHYWVCSRYHGHISQHRGWHRSWGSLCWTSLKLKGLQPHAQLKEWCSSPGSWRNTLRTKERQETGWRMGKGGGGRHEGHGWAVQTLTDSYWCLVGLAVKEELVPKKFLCLEMVIICKFRHGPIYCNL